MNKIETLRIYGRIWFQKTYGNTYHAVRVIVNGEEIVSDIIYGYGDHYKETARQLLEGNGFEVPEHSNLTDIFMIMGLRQQQLM